MHMQTPQACRLCSLLLIIVFTAVCQPIAQQYEVTDLGATGYLNQPWAANQNGNVAGYSELADGHDEGFVYIDGEFILIGYPPKTSRSDLLGINIQNEAAGKSGTTYESGQAILWTPHGGPRGKIQSLGTLGGSRSAAYSINDLTQVVGWSHLPGDTASRAFIWQDGLMEALPVLGGTQAKASWINNSGQIVGSSTTDTDGLTQFAVVWENGTVTRLPPFYEGLNHIARYIHDNGDVAGTVTLPGGSAFIRRAAVWRNNELYLRLGTLADGTPVEPYASSSASGVNADGVVVGMSVNAQSQYVPFVWRDGQMTQLDDLMPDPWVAVFVGAGAINDAGQITVSAHIPGEDGNHALLLTPIPEAGVPPRDEPESPVLFARGMNIVYRIPETAPVLMRVFDVNGRMLARLVDSVESASQHEIYWDGLTISGHPAASGFYYVQLKTTRFALSCPLILVR